MFFFTLDKLKVLLQIYLPPYLLELCRNPYFRTYFQEFSPLSVMNACQKFALIKNKSFHEDTAGTLDPPLAMITYTRLYLSLILASCPTNLRELLVTFDTARIGNFTHIIVAHLQNS